MPTSKFALKTDVPVARSQDQIRKTLQDYGATKFAFYQEESEAAIAFELSNRRIRFSLQVPAKAVSKQDQQLERTRWRCLLLAIKAKLEATASGISTVEDEFMAFTVMPNGKTVSELLTPEIESAYKNGKMPPLLLSGKK